eukprot:GDKK01022599.1.p1 GENE.GDKK01022599.1~~GDKK01022599.1.p1  ORF type:complete len:252 (-),score=68.52 GDKK01022599.1:63-818(-)
MGISSRILEKVTMSTDITSHVVSEIDLLTKYWNLTEGRDKFSKSVQYGARLLAHIFANDKDLANRFGNLQKVTADARKIFRVGKSANEYMKIRELLKTESADKYTNILCRSAFFGYWVFDNLQILSKVGFLKGDTKQYGKKAATFWLVGLILSIFLELYKLHKIQQKEAAAADSGAVVDFAKHRAEKNTIYLNLIKNIGDSLSASHNSEITTKLMGRSWNEGAIAMGGLVSGLISVYQQYPSRAAAKPKQA